MSTELEAAKRQLDQCREKLSVACKRIGELAEDTHHRILLKMRNEEPIEKVLLSHARSMDSDVFRVMELVHEFELLGMELEAAWRSDLELV